MDVPHPFHGVSITLGRAQTSQQLLVLTFQCLLVGASRSRCLCLFLLIRWFGLFNDLKKKKKKIGDGAEFTGDINLTTLTVATSFCSLSLARVLILAEWWYAAIPLVTSLLAATHPSF